MTASVGPAAVAGRSQELKIVAKCLLSGGVEDSFHHRASKICALTFFLASVLFFFFFSKQKGVYKKPRSEPPPGALARLGASDAILGAPWCWSVVEYLTPPQQPLPAPAACRADFSSQPQGFSSIGCSCAQHRTEGDPRKTAATRNRQGLPSRALFTAAFIERNELFFVMTSS